jgi:hypothetical protein
MSFPPATEMVQFAGFASSSYGFTEGYPKGVGCPIRTSRDQQLLALPPGFSQRATSFIASRCQGIHQMPLSRARPRPAPSAHAVRAWQRTEDRRQRTDKMPELPALFCSLFSVIWSLEPGASRQGKAPWRSHTHARIRPRRTWPDPLHGFTTRFTMSENREQRTENRPDDRPFVPSANSKRQASETGDRLSPVLLTVRGPDPTPREPGPAGPRRRLLSSVPCRLIFACLVGLGRLERPTSRLSGVRSNQLSYRPMARDQRTDDRRQTRRSGVSRAAHVGSVL